jgi:hypothetical protein
MIADGEQATFRGRQWTALTSCNSFVDDSTPVCRGVVQYKKDESLDVLTAAELINAIQTVTLV